MEAARAGSCSMAALAPRLRGSGGGAARLEVRRGEDSRRGGGAADCRFRFESFWCKLDGFTEVVQNAWSAPCAIQDPISRLDFKLRATGRALQSWSDKKVGNVKLQLEMARELIGKFDRMEESRRLSAQERFLHRALKKKYLALASLERTMARQRSRILWLQEGDANTRFFHQHAAYRRRRNFVQQIEHNSQIATAPDEKAVLAQSYFTDVLGLVGQRAFTLELDFLEPRGQLLSELEEPFTVDEVWRAIVDSPRDKAPGPDGFSGQFYHCFWGIIQEDVLAALNQLHRMDGSSLHKVNKAFISLLPKRPDAKNLKDFWPISLVHSFVKLFTKILSRCLAPKLDSLVAKNQSTFVKKRCIHDNFMLVRQSAKRLHDRKVPSVLLKLDIAKAFDTISWPFILEVLEHKGFGHRWRSWIAMLFRTASSRVLINGEPGGPIVHRRGVRQGDPISPMIFIIAMDMLSPSEELLRPLGIPFQISLYADDVVAFIRPALWEIRAATEILAIFGEASGLRTNFAKCSALPIQCNEADHTLLRDELPCQVASFPCTYLGLPLSIFRLKKEDLQLLVDRIARRLPSWIADLMTPIGRATMVNAVLSSIPIYLLMAINVPKWVIKGIDKIHRGFLWAGKAVANGGVCRVAWPRVCAPKEFGGLGIPDLERMGIALRSRWLWQQRNSPDKPWHGLNIPVSQKERNLVTISMICLVGDGTSVLFWEDNWLEGSSIRSLAPAVYAAVPSRLRNRRTVAEALHDRRWVRDIAAALGIQAILEYLKLWEILRAIQLTAVPDSLIWRWESSGEYSSWSAYRALLSGRIHFEYKPIWKSWAPPRCCYFLWLVALNRCWTADCLRSHGLSHPACCVLCDQSDETIDHLLVACPESRQLWWIALRAIGHSECLPINEPSFHIWLCDSRKKVIKAHRRGFDTIATLVAWTIWKERNIRVFNQINRSWVDIARAMAGEADLWRLARAAIPSVVIHLDREGSPNGLGD
uniref:Retrotransposon protein, putative, LINE subclass n=1 Tax=Oryza sativa subsp. japonica TaxID=39947 RepID=Q2QSK7_ORYSJ|nr:retrotransposon protein, putative, LINE subclass [Oryza sativa Japonica Group]